MLLLLFLLPFPAAVFLWLMDLKHQDVEDLSSKIRSLGWDEFHTLLTPVNPDEDLVNPAVVGKILANRLFSSSVVIATMKAAWNFVTEFSTEEMEPTTFLFSFSKQPDQEKVLAQTPWNLRGHLMVTKPWSSELTIPRF